MKVDTIIKNANIFNVFTKKWIFTDLSILNGKILYIGDTQKEKISANEIINIDGRYIIPSFIDIHMHIESSFCTPQVFANEAIKHGITTVVAEPHEIANVFAREGISQMIEKSRNLLVDIFFGLPSSVPSTSKDLEGNGGEITKEDIAYLIKKYDEIICLGEVMHYRTFINDFENLAKNKSKDKIIELINTVKKENKLFAIEGHCPSVIDFDLASILYFGVDSDHCLQTPKTMINRFEQGMFVQLQDKSITKENINLLNKENYEGLYSFVTDDCPPDIFVEKGHLDYIFRKAISLGLSFEKAIIASSYSPAKRMNFRDRGALAPGYIADFLIIDKLDESFKLDYIFKSGLNINKQYLEQNKNNNKNLFPKAFYKSINVHKDFDITKALKITANYKKNVTVKIMRKNNLSTYTELEYKEISVKNNVLVWENLDLNLVLSINRYGINRFATGFMDGSAIKNGAFCSTHAHDSHNILLLGDNKKDMILAYNRILEIQGGMIFVSNGIIVEEIPLPVAGVICETEMDILSKKISNIQIKLRKSGVNHVNPLMSLLTLSLPVSPSIKISDKGLIDVSTQKIVSLFE